MENDGLYGIYAVLAEEKLARRWERPLRRLTPDVDKLVLWEPLLMDDKNWQELQDWVNKGHTLIVASDDDWLPGRIRSGDETVAGSGSAHTLTLDVGAVAVGGSAFADLKGAPLVHLTRPDGTPVLVSWAQGQGRIYWSADPEWLANGHIRGESNLDLALHLLVPAPGMKTAFDEYNHGFQAPERWWQILRGSLQAFVLQLVAALVLFYWAAGARFGAPSPLPAMVPRASVEYVYSMSQLYRRARARTVALRALHRSLTRDLSRFLGGAGNLSFRELAERVAGRTGMAAERIERALARTAPEAKPQPDDTELIHLSREVDAIQRSVYNAGYRDQRDAGARPR